MSSALQVVTVGDAATERFETLQRAGEYTEAYYVHGLAVETAEAVAEWMHRRIRREWGLAASQGKRYSWGYGACPDLDDHATVFRLLPVADALGMSLTSAGQLVPGAVDGGDSSCIIPTRSITPSAATARGRDEARVARRRGDACVARAAA